MDFRYKMVNQLVPTFCFHTKLAFKITRALLFNILMSISLYCVGVSGKKYKKYLIFLENRLYSCSSFISRTLFTDVKELIWKSYFDLSIAASSCSFTHSGLKISIIENVWKLPYFHCMPKNIGWKPRQSIITFALMFVDFLKNH